MSYLPQKPWITIRNNENLYGPEPKWMLPLFTTAEYIILNQNLPSNGVAFTEESMLILCGVRPAKQAVGALYGWGGWR
jgi:hypothetical protein